MHAINIQNDVIGLVLREKCKSKQMSDFIAWQSRCHDTIQAWLYTISDEVKEWLNTNENSYLLLKGGIRRFCFDLATLRILKFDHWYWDWKYNKLNSICQEFKHQKQHEPTLWWMSNCCLTTGAQFCSYMIARTDNISTR